MSTHSTSTEGTLEPTSTPVPDSNDPRNRSRVRKIEPTHREQQPQEDTVHYSSSSSDSESDSDDSPSPQYEDTVRSRNSNQNIPSPFDREGFEHQSVRLREREGQNHNVQPASSYKTVRLRTRPDRVVWEPEFTQKETKKKATKAVKNVIKIKPRIPAVKKEKVKKDGCLERFKQRVRGPIERFKERFKKKKTEEEGLLEPEPEEPPSTVLSPEMEKANSEGYDMMKKVFFPSIPAVFQDLWVYLELAISIAAFVVGFLGDGNLPSSGFEYFYVVLASIAMIMALIDGFIYFFQLGSCARGIKFCVSVYKKRKGQGPEDDDDEEEEPKKRCGMSPETQEKFNTWFELARNLINEFLVYPLLVLDLFDYICESIGNNSYVPEEGESLGQTNFGFFVIGSFYLFLAVYIMRVVMVFGTLVSLIQLPSNKEASGTDKNSSLLIKFCIHVIGQILVHFVIIIVIATKIRNENDPNILCLPPGSANSTTTTNVTVINTLMSNDTMGADDDDGDPIASPFLITSIVMGGILPLCGVAAFFVVNYFWLREFSIGFWLNMLSMLQGASFAETVFGGDGLSSAEEQANEFLDDSGFDAVKTQIGRYKENSFWTKFFYPSKVPWVALCGVLYDLALVAFVVTLMLRYDEQHGVRLAVFCDDDPALTSTFIIATVTILVANIHVLLLLNFLLLVIIVIGIAACLYSLALIPIILLIYLPMMGLVGYFFLFRDSFNNCGKSKKYSMEDDDLTLGNPSATNLDDGMEMKTYDVDSRKSSSSLEVKVDITMGQGSSGSRSSSGTGSPMLLFNKEKVES